MARAEVEYVLISTSENVGLEIHNHRLDSLFSRAAAEIRLNAFALRELEDLDRHEYTTETTEMYVIALRANDRVYVIYIDTPPYALITTSDHRFQST